jgi:eukaryotic translation initiation factor 2C
MLDYQNSPFMQDARITVHPDSISVSGRLLPMPSIHYGNAASNKSVVRPRRHEAHPKALIFNSQVPQNGSWNVVDQTFHELKALSTWEIFNYTRMNEVTINRFVGTLINICKKLGAAKHLPSTISD